MAKKLNIFIFIFLTYFATEAFSASMSEKFFRKDEPIEVNADKVSYDKVKKSYEASGTVVITQGELRLEAETLTMDMERGVGVAEGSVLIKDRDGNIFEGDRVDLDLNNELVMAVNARLYFKEETVTFTGREIEKTGVNTYRGKRLGFTSCDCPPDKDWHDYNPPWSLHVSSAKVRVGGMFTGWNVLFKVKGVPILYLPFIAAPVVNERQTGFLIPTFGYSDVTGSRLGNSFFINLADNADITLYHDYDDKKGYGGGAEFRYLRTDDNFGEMSFYSYRERDLERVRSYREDPDYFNLGRPLSATDDRWELKYHQHEKILGGVIFKADATLVSDEEYYLDVGDNERGRTLDMLESTVSLNKSWDASNLVIEARAFDDLTVDKDLETYHKLPEIKYTRSARRIWKTPLFLSLHANGTNFYKRADGVRGRRIDLRPTVSAPFRLGVLEVTPSYTPVGTYYNTFISSSTAKTVTEKEDRHHYESSLDIASTFVNLWKSNESEGKVDRMFSVRPRVKYDYTYDFMPDRRQNDFPYYDEYDRLENKNLVNYSLNFTFSGLLKDGEFTGRHEYFYWDIGQYYDVARYRDDTIEKNDRNAHSNITSELVIKPTLHTRLRSRMEYDPYLNQIVNHDADISYRNGKNSLFALEYRYIRDEQEFASSNINLHLFGGFGIINRTKYTIYYIDDTVIPAMEYTNETIENTGGFFYNAKCWGVTLTYTDKIDDEVVMFAISLKGLGEIGTRAGSN